MTAAVRVRDWHGVQRAYRRSDGAAGPSLRALVRPPLRLDRRGVMAAWGLLDEPERTVVLDVRKLPCASDAGMDSPAGGWSAIFESEVSRMACGARSPVLALGGGLDAAAVLAAWRASGAPLPAVLTLETGLAGYDEVEEASAIAASLGARCEVFSLPPEHLVALVPEAIAAAETPLYNLHPVSRLALARAARERGYETLITGDGADAAFAGRPDHDYVPIVAALTEAGGMKLASPFFSGRTLAATLAGGNDPDKRALRAYVAEMGLPGWLAVRPKRARWMPALDLSCYLSLPLVESLARELSIELRLDSDRAAVGWATLGLLVQSLGGNA